MSQKISALHEEVENSSFYITEGNGLVTLKRHGNETDLLISLSISLAQVPYTTVKAFMNLASNSRPYS